MLKKKVNKLVITKIETNTQCHENLDYPNATQTIVSVCFYETSLALANAKFSCLFPKNIF